GWASWRRAWQYYDIEMKLWPAIREMNFLRDILVDPEAVKVWTWVLQSTYEGSISTWDFQWTLTSWLRNGLSVTPNVNLVSNLGFGAEATNTKNSKSKIANIPTEAMEFPLKHPQFMIRDAQADRFTQKTFYNYLGVRKKILTKIEQILELWS
ncbi:MAG: glycosyltransferase family 2 protein, partial [Xenococcaceae cyanobacterium]